MTVEVDARTQRLFENGLIEANRALITLGAIERRELDTAPSQVVHNCLRAYTNLLMFKHTIDLNPKQQRQLQTVLDRLKANLQFFEGDV